MRSVDRLFEEARQLPVDLRLTLVSRLLRSDEPSISEEVEEEWDVVIRERIRRYDEGKAESRPAGEVFADLDRRLKL
ncbi:MAG TPA: addiction module protein [Trueperaceae bacterium]|nr:addiction module protein [Trueperaceae bacterium]